MRREERHHLKENPVAVLLTAARAWLAERGRSVLAGAGIVALVLIAAGGYFSWTQLQQQRAGEMLAAAMTVLEAPVIQPPEPPAVETKDGDDAAAPTAGDGVPATPPKVEVGQPTGSYPSLDARLEAALPVLLAVGDAYPDTQQGVLARYEAAGVLVLLGRVSEAVPHYQQVADTAGDSLYQQMALMGLAEAYLLEGQPQNAIALLEIKTGAVESLVPVDAVLMRLGRAYEMAGQPDDALATFNRVVEEFPLSVYYADAQDEVETLRQDTGGRPSSGE